MDPRRPNLEEYALVDSQTHTHRRSSSLDESRHQEDAHIPHFARREGVHLATIEEKKRLWWKNAVINLLFIASWFLFATLISIYNKWMFAPEHFGFPAPLFVTTMHFFMQFILGAVFRYGWPKRFRPKQSPTVREYGKKVAPTAIATGLDIGLSNVSLKFITLSFYTMCKSSSLIFVLLFAFLFRLERFSWRLVGVIGLTFSGVILMVATETHFVLHGFILVITASCLGGLRWSLTQILLKDKGIGMDNPAATIFWLSPSMGLTLAVASVAIEGWWTLFQTKFFQGIWTTLITMLYLSGPGVIAFFMVLSEYYIIQRVGVMPMSIAGIAKEVSTITLSAWFFGDKLTPLNMTGVGITVCGIGLFTYHKYRKSMDSTVPLDEHGNPIADSDVDLTGADAEETAHLTAIARSEELDEETTLDEGSRPWVSPGRENRPISL